MHRDERRIARFYQFFVFRRCKTDIERHQTVVQKRIDRARRLNGELRVKFYRILQIAQALLQHRRHLFQARRCRYSALAGRVIFLFQQRKNRIGAFADVNLRVRPLEFENAIFEIGILQLRAKENRVDALVLWPTVDLHRADFFEQRVHMQCALRDFRRRIIGQPIVPRVQSGIATAHRIIFIAPRIVIVGQRVQRRCPHHF